MSYFLQFLSDLLLEGGMAVFAKLVSFVTFVSYLDN